MWDYARSGDMGEWRCVETAVKQEQWRTKNKQNKKSRYVLVPTSHLTSGPSKTWWILLNPKRYTFILGSELNQCRFNTNYPSINREARGIEPWFSSLIVSCSNHYSNTPQEKDRCFYVYNIIPCLFMKSLIMAVLPDPGGPTSSTFCPRAQVNSMSTRVRVYETTYNNIGLTVRNYIFHDICTVKTRRQFLNIKGACTTSESRRLWKEGVQHRWFSKTKVIHNVDLQTW